MTSNGSTVEDWASLPKDLLYLIFNGLSIQDWIPFSGVSNHWRSVAHEKFRQPHHRLLLRDHQLSTGRVLLPLLLHQLRLADGGERWSSYSVTTQQSAGELELLKWPPHQTFCGCCWEWLIMCDSRRAQISLWNPFSRDDLIIPLPVLTKLLSFNGHMASVYPVIGVLSGPPDTGQDYILLVRYGVARRLAIIGSSDNDWAYFVGGQTWGVEGINYCNGVFFALCNSGKDILLIDARSRTARRVTPSCRRPPRFDERLDVLYLVKHWEKGREHLLKVVMKPKKNFFKTRFHVYELEDGSDGKKQWMEVRRLGDASLFLGGHHSISLPSSAFGGCRPNSIYFYRTSRIGVFDLKNGTISTLDDQSLGHHLKHMKHYPFLSSPPIWIVPPIISHVTC